MLIPLTEIVLYVLWNVIYHVFSFKSIFLDFRCSLFCCLALKVEILISVFKILMERLYQISSTCGSN
jgi:sulfite reductase alpha subunit-like flavoprotein